MADLIDGMGRPLLLVEDDQAVLSMFELMLRTMNWDVLPAHDGEEAWQWLSEHTGTLPAALLTDYLMPRLDGGELARRVRAQASFSDLPIVVITAIPPGDARLDEVRVLPRCLILSKTEAASRQALADALADVLGPRIG